MIDFAADTHPTLAERRALARKRVTVNGERAVIGGVRNHFATVTRLSDGASWEWSWHAARRVVGKGGRFAV